MVSPGIWTLGKALIMLDRRDVLAGLASAAVMSSWFASSANGAETPGYNWQEDFSRLPGVTLMGDEDIAMLLYPGFTALDLIGPYHFFAGMMGARIHLVTNQADLSPVASDMGLAVQPTVRLADCPRDLTILFAPGGTDGTIAAARDPDTISFVRDRASRAMFVTSVCTGALILGAAGLLKGKRATTHWSVRPLLGRFGATPVDARVVRDGNLVTGAGVSAGLDFGLSIVAQLRGQPYAAASMLTAEYHPEPPFEGGTLSTTPANVAKPMTALFEGFVEATKTLGVAQ
ncbi:DJ-1/PfpI family protein [Stappia sp. MMSF_3263]|uniref:DJ-1/PfpI family protein n=1 Tax=Stappia sp. MMSF_3263 TaxID=3046693 RepID=UPI00273F209F|nr:DJ-1/PfpI family protein [Stappia sp. MMSF_3263]